MADENVGVNPPDYETISGKVRVLVGDTDPKPMTDPLDKTHGQYAWFSDAELDALATMNGMNPKRVAIWVLSQVAISNALLLKKWNSDDLQVDGPAITRGIEATLKRLSAEVDKDDFLLGDSEFFGIYGGDYYPRVLFEHGNTGWWLDD